MKNVSNNNNNFERKRKEKLKSFFFQFKVEAVVYKLRGHQAYATVQRHTSCLKVGLLLHPIMNGSAYDSGFDEDDFIKAEKDVTDGGDSEVIKKVHKFIETARQQLDDDDSFHPDIAEVVGGYNQHFSEEEDGEIVSLEHNEVPMQEISFSVENENNINNNNNNSPPPPPPSSRLRRHRRRRRQHWQNKKRKTDSLQRKIDNLLKFYKNFYVLNESSVLVYGYDPDCVKFLVGKRHKTKNTIAFKYKVNISTPGKFYNKFNYPICISGKNRNLLLKSLIEIERILFQY